METSKPSRKGETWGKTLLSAENVKMTTTVLRAGWWIQVHEE